MSTLKVNTLKPITDDADLSLQGDSGGSPVDCLNIDSSGNIDFSGNTDAKIKLPSAGGIYESDGSTALLTESGGSVTLDNITLSNGVQDTITRLGTVTSGTFNGTFPAGHILQLVSTTITGQVSLSPGSSYIAVTGLAQSITPASTSNDVLITITLGRVSPNVSSGSVVAFKLQRGGSDIGMGGTRPSSFVTSSTANNNYNSGGFSFQYLDSPSSTSATTYTLVCHVQADADVKINTSYLGGTSSEAYDTISTSTITCMEVSG